MRLFVFFILIFLCFDFSFSQNEKNINGDIFLFQGNTAYRKGNFQQAEELYRKGLLLPSDHKSQGYFNLANSLYNQKKYDLAENEYINSLNLLDENNNFAKSKIYYNIANLYLEQKKYENAIDYYIKALSLNPLDSDAQYNLNYAWKMMQQSKNNNKEKNDQNKNDQNQSDNDKQNQQDEQNKQNQQQDNNENKQQNQDNKQNQKTMSKEEIERLLKAMQQKELQTQQQLRDTLNYSKSKSSIEKDW
ncbi:MAG TPA: tetratricopeptide repeat protein [Bacteroidales bacterium]|nr:tetratricopeptide repeat protein [Bacteroidales bacterium]HPZ36916.1 tetratricopeptide repeat protein [Bacteroidales bacterium]HQD35224.1 tetratricopeptide repeat protein [Bacteroidales bacterium]